MFPKRIRIFQHLELCQKQIHIIVYRNIAFFSKIQKNATCNRILPAAGKGVVSGEVYALSSHHLYDGIRLWHFERFSGFWFCVCIHAPRSLSVDSDLPETIESMKNTILPHGKNFLYHFLCRQIYIHNRGANRHFIAKEHLPE